MNNIKSILVVGNSYALGGGIPDIENNPDILWVNRFCKELAPGATVDNLSQSGRDSHWIFVETLSQLLRKKYDLVLVAWAGTPFYNYNFGLELYSVHSLLNDVEINVNNLTIIQGQWAKELGDKLRKYHNDHWDLLDMVKYVNILVNAHENIYFINAQYAFNDGYFDRKESLNLRKLSDYEKTILDFNNRDDDETKNLYKSIHDQYEYYGGIHPERWLNLYHGFKKLTIDVAANDGKHPGIKSQKNIADFLLEQYKKMKAA